MDAHMNSSGETTIYGRPLRDAKVNMSASTCHHELITSKMTRRCLAKCVSGFLAEIQNLLS